MCCGEAGKSIEVKTGIKVVSAIRGGAARGPVEQGRVGFAAWKSGEKSELEMKTF